MIYHPRWITKKKFHMFSDSIDYEILNQDRMRFEKKISFYMYNFFSNLMGQHVRNLMGHIYIKNY
jgi:hypothetical protein